MSQSGKVTGNPSVEAASRHKGSTPNERHLHKRQARKQTALPEDQIVPSGKWLRYGLYPALLALVVFFCAFRPIADPDVWFHMAFGHTVVEQHALPHIDPYSCNTAGRQWISSGWAPSVMLYWLYEKSGLGSAGPLLLTVLVIGAAYLLVYYAGVRRYTNAGSLALVLMAALLGSYPRFAPRPDIFSQLCVACLVLLLVTAEEQAKAKPDAFPRRLWLLPLLIVLWANLHVGFLAGFAPIGLYALWKLQAWYKTRSRTQLIALLPCVLSLVVWIANPYATRITELVGRNKALDQWRHNFEWMPFVYFPEWDVSWKAFKSCNLSWHILGGTGALLLLCGFSAWKRRAQIAWWQHAVAAVFLFSGLSQRRQMGLTALVIPAVYIAQLGALDLALARRRRLLTAGVVAGAVLICLMRLGGFLDMRWGSFELLILPAVTFTNHQVGLAYALPYTQEINTSPG